jgi:outer membrane protein assembly factor BamB
MQKRFIPLIFLILTMVLLLTACTGIPVAAGWPASTVVDKTIYTSSGQYVYAVNTETGQQTHRWPEKAENGKIFSAAPVILSDGKLVVGDYNSELNIIDPNVDPTTFTTKTKDATGKYIAPSLVLKDHDDLILAPNSDHSLYAYSKAGKFLWKFSEAKNNLWSQPVTDGKTVFVASMDKNVYAIDPAADGKVLWSKDLGGSVMFSLALANNGSLYIGTLNNELFSIDSTTGKINWQVKTSGAVWSPVLVQDDTIYAGDQSGKVFALSTKDGSKVWELDAGSPVIGGLAFSDKGLFFGTEKGDAICVSTSGAKVWTTTVGGKLYSTPVISGSSVIFGVFEGDKTLAALDEKNGTLVWGFTPAK